MFSNPMMLIVLAVLALVVLGGNSSLNLTDLLMSLLRSLNLVPQPKGTPSEQVFRGYVTRAWKALRETGDRDKTRALLDAAVDQAETHIAQEQAIEPAGIKDTLKEWLKSPIFLIAIALGAFLIFGGGSCKQPAPQPQTGFEPTPAVSWSQPLQMDATWTLCRYAPPDEPAEMEWQFAECPVIEQLAAEQTGWMSAGPVRRVASAPVRAVARAKPLRRLGGAIFRARPLQRLFGRR